MVAGRIDGILATNATSGLQAVDAVGGASRRGRVKVGAFDLGPDTLHAVQKGKLLFAVDQQPYLQGYLPVVMLANRARYGLLPGAGRRRRDGSELRHPRERRPGARAQRALHPLTTCGV